MVTERRPSLRAILALIVPAPDLAFLNVGRLGFNVPCMSGVMGSNGRWSSWGGLVSSKSPAAQLVHHPVHIIPTDT